MTSRSSFSNVLREDRKRRIWPFVLFVMMCFLMTAAFELNLESYISRELAFVKIQSNIERLTRTGMITTYLIFAGIAACLFGFQGFGWLTKKEQVDFYHSQPMRREKRFKVIYINGIIMCLIPMVLHVAAYTFLIGIRGYLSVIVAQNIFMNLLIFLAAFLMMYHLVILAVMLSGNMIVSFVLCGIIFVYSSIVKSLVLAFFETFFKTFASGYSDGISWIGYLSPVERVYRAGNYMVRGLWQEAVVSVLILAVMAVIMLAAAYYLYKKRPSEAAGNALAYPVVGDFIRFLIVIPSGMFFGIMFASLGVMSNVFWLYFGTIVGAVLAHGFMEVIFHFDIKAALRKKGQLAAGTILVLCIANIFCFDIFGYDSYIPKEEKVKEVSYFINIGEYNSNYHLLGEDGVPVVADRTVTDQEVNSAAHSSISPYDYKVYDSSTYVYRENYQMEASKTENAGPVLDLIREYMKAGEDKSGTGQSFQMIVHYELKNGKDVYRRYMVDRAVVEESYDPIYNTEEGKKVIYPYWNLSGDMVQEVLIYTPFMTEKRLELSSEEIKELAECYKKDIGKQSLSEMLAAQYIAEAEFRYDRAELMNENGTIGLSLSIADHHKNMIKFFETRDIYLTLPNKYYEVTEMTVFNCYGADDTADHPFWKGRDEATLTVKEREEMIPIAVPDQYGYNGREMDYLLHGYMTVRNKETGSMKQVYFNVPSSLTPNYMKVGE